MDTYQNALKLLQSGNPQAAIPLFRAAIEQSALNAEWMKNLGNAWRAVGDLDQAVACYRDALRINAEHMPSHNNLALVLRSKGLFADAEVHFRHAHRIAPEDSDILTNLGVVLIDQQKLEEAQGFIERALFINRNDLFAWQSLALIQRRQGSRKQALLTLDNCLALAPAAIEFWLEKSDIFDELREPVMSSECLKQACSLSSEDPRVQIRLGMLAINEARYADAIPFLQQAQQADEFAAMAHYGLGKAQLELGNYQQAKHHLELALKQNPNALDALGLLLMARLHACDWDGLASIIERVRTLVAQQADARMPPFLFLATGAAPDAMLDCAQKYTANVIAPIAQASGVQPYPALIKRHNRIRLGYLSGDFREHPLARLVAEMFELHDRDKFEIYAYCYSPDDGSAIRQRLIEGVDHFCSIKGLNPAASAQRIHQDEIDILIDLTGYTGDTHSEILALRPAAVQVSYLGYLATTGADFVDYIIADEQAIPKTDDQFFSEKVVRLPFYQASDRTRKSAPVLSRKELGLPQDAFIYCCFNQPYKITPQLFGRWMNILQAVPGSVLWLYAFHTSTRENLLEAASDYGINRSRIIFAQRASMEDHIARMRVADLFLDTAPYNAGATASDALWAGLPILTCPGSGFASRMCASLVHAAGMPELIANSPEEYEQIAIELAQDRPRLEGLAGRLREQRQSMALFDSPGTVLNLEKAFIDMFNRAQQGKAPEAIDIKA